MHQWLGGLALVGILAPGLAAQDTASVARPRIAATITLQEALQQARANSPTYRQALNDADPARWGVRNAYGAWLPTLSVASSFGYTGAGQANFGAGFTQRTSSLLSSGYQIGLSWQMSGRTLMQPRQEKALQQAVDQDIDGAGVALRAEITLQYLTALQAAAQAEVARQQVRRNDEFLTLAQARQQVGQATMLEVRQAEVTKRTSEVALLRAEQADMEAKLELLRRMGVTPPVPVDQIALTDSFPVVEPQFQLEELLKTAEAQNPTLRSLTARENAARVAMRIAKSEYLPSLSLGAGWGGFTQRYTNENVLLNQQFAAAQSGMAACDFQNQVRTALSLGGQVPNCFAASGLTDDGTALLDPVAAGIRSQNDHFPFGYTHQPFNLSLTISLPIFTGFSRSRGLSVARAQQQDVEEGLRARRLEVQTEVHSRYLAVSTAYKTIAVQAAARDAAREQLRLAQDRYRLGAGSSLEVTDAQTAVQRAEGDYVTTVYDYHKAIAALESAVGRPLR